MITYANGNTEVTIKEDGTKIRQYEGTPQPMFPESIDIKITNYCDLGCSYCHEQSTLQGKHGDLRSLYEVIKDLPAGVEVALGGGNPLAHPDLVWFLLMLKDKGIIANITINQNHLKQYYSLLEGLIKSELVTGIGISITHNNFTYVDKIKALTNNVVYHIIAGVHDVCIIDSLISIGNDCKILVLGYKKFGRGVNYYTQSIEDNMSEWYRYISKYTGKCLLSFDNLAIEQLSIKRLFTESGWDRFYMGDDFSFSVYIDAVEQAYSPTSRSSNRTNWSGVPLLNYFQTNRRCDV